MFMYVFKLKTVVMNRGQISLQLVATVDVFFVFYVVRLAQVNQMMMLVRISWHGRHGDSRTRKRAVACAGDLSFIAFCACLRSQHSHTHTQHTQLINRALERDSEKLGSRGSQRLGSAQSSRSSSISTPIVGLTRRDGLRKCVFFVFVCWSEHALWNMSPRIPKKSARSSKSVFAPVFAPVISPARSQGEETDWERWRTERSDGLKEVTDQARWQIGWGYPWGNSFWNSRSPDVLFSSSLHRVLFLKHTCMGYAH